MKHFVPFLTSFRRLLRLFTIVTMILTGLAACQIGGEPFNRWYGYGVGDVLSPSDMDGVPKLGGGGKLVRLKPKGDWPWDVAVAELAPGDIITGLRFSIRGCEPSPMIEFGPPPPPKCSKSEATMASLGKKVRSYVAPRMVAEPQPDGQITPFVSEPMYDDNGYGQYWLFEDAYLGCDNHKVRGTPIYAAPYRDPTGKVGEVAISTDRSDIGLTVKIAHIERFRIYYQNDFHQEEDLATRIESRNNYCRGGDSNFLKIENISDMTKYNNTDWGPTVDTRFVSPPYKIKGVLNQSDFLASDKFFERGAIKNSNKISISVKIDNAGNATNCDVTDATHWHELSDLVCEFAKRRFKYYPAKNYKGDPIASQQQYLVRWTS